MKKIFFTVGPSKMHPNAEGFIKESLKKDIPSISHRGAGFAVIYEHTVKSLKKLMGIPYDYYVFFQGSATEAMERVIENTVEQRSMHIVNGAFSNKIYKFAGMLGKSAVKMDIVKGSGLKKAVSIDKSAEILTFVHNETSTGVSQMLEVFYKIRERNPDLLMAVDVVSSAPVVRLDFKMLDMVYFSVQKGFGMPAGLGVLVVSPRAMEKAGSLARKGINIGSYHNFQVMEEYAKKSQTHETPNAMWIYLLGKICDEFLKKGLKSIRAESAEKAEMIYEYFDRKSKHKPFVTDLRFRSETTIVIDTRGKADRVVRKMAEEGFVVGSGYGERRSTQIRIANFPSHSLKEVRNLIDAFDCVG